MNPDIRLFGHCQGEACYWFNRAFRGLDWVNERDKAWFSNEALMEAMEIEARIDRELTDDEYRMFIGTFIHAMSNLRDQERMLNDDTWCR